MKFNPDCVRDILLSAQDVIEPNQPLEIGTPSQHERLKNYSEKEIIFHVIECGNSKLIQYHNNVLGEYFVDSVTDKGRDFLAKIESDSSWKAVLSKGVSSITSLLSVSETVLGIAGSIKDML